jgi:Malectin domain
VIAGVLVLGLISLGNRLERKPANPLPILPAGDSIRILAGLAEGSFTDGFGHVWASDNYFHGGSVVTLTNHPIWGTRDPRLYQTRREGAFSYDIPAKPGDYELRLYFAETYYGDGNVAGYGGENTRSFAISINGEQVKSHFMVAGEAGINTSLVKVFKDINPARDGMIHIAFIKGNGEPFVNAIELTPGVHGKLTPIRLIAQAQGYTDRSGQVWVFDRAAVGGTVVGRTAEVTGQDDPQLYAGERFGHFSYTIPVTTGTYTVVLHMAERWLGPGQPKGGIGTGSRVFDILCNGVYLERDFDVFSKAGGANRALVRTYRGIQPNHQSNIVLSFAPFHNFPMVSALEILDESK